MQRMLLAAMVIACLGILEAHAQVRRPSVVISADFGAHVQLSAAGSPLTGGGAMTYGTTVVYPMTVTSGSISGDYVMVSGMIQGSSSRVAYKLYVNKRTNNAYWSIPAWGLGKTGKGTATVTQ